MRGILPLLLFLTAFPLRGADTLRVDVNRASREELQKLPLSPAQAESLYKYIQTRGPLTSVYELLQVPGIDRSTFYRIKDRVIVSHLREGRNFAFYVERIRERGAREESPREAAFDEWITLLRNPIPINEATVDELYRLEGVSLIDAASVVAYTRLRRIRSLRDLRRVPGLSYYGYRNLRDFVTFETPRPRPLGGWLHLRTTYFSEVFPQGSDLTDRIGELQDTTGEGNLPSLLRASGWSEAEIESLLARLRREREETRGIQPRPALRVKGRLDLGGHWSVGLLHHTDPYRYNAPLTKGYLAFSGRGFLRTLYLGHYRITLGQGLFLDNTDEMRDRLFYRTRGLFGDLTSTRAFDLFGVAAQLRLRGFAPLFFFSRTLRDALLGKSGMPLFYYAGTYTPTDYRDRLTETLYGTSLRYDFPPPFPIGTQIALNFMDLRYDRPLSADFRELDLPGDADSLAGDPALRWNGAPHKRFFGVEFRTVRAPLSLEGEWAQEEGGGWAWVLRWRLQARTFFIHGLIRHYDMDYTNPFHRGFQEDGRFEDTPLERPYRLLDPMAAELARFPLPKPETGLYVETRFQPLRQVLFPRVYADIWRDNTDGLWNYRIQMEVEFRPVFPFRLRLRERWQLRQNYRGLGITRSFSDEMALRGYVLLEGFDFLGFEARYARVQLTPRESYPQAEIRGGFLALYLTHNFSRHFEARLGAILWRTQGLSQWAFEDTGIDFLYGDGSKYYLTFLERLSSNLGVKLKLRWKSSRFPLSGFQGVVDSEGREIYRGFFQPEDIYSLEFSLDYSF